MGIAPSALGKPNSPIDVTLYLSAEKAPKINLHNLGAFWFRAMHSSHDNSRLNKCLIGELYGKL
jgi:hypothetical protein